MAIIDQNKESLKQREQRIGYLRDKLDKLVEETWDDGNEHFPPTSFQISNIRGGVGVTNVIPDSVEVDFNFRYSTASSDKSLKDRVAKIIEKFTSSYKLNWSLSGKPFLTRSTDLIKFVSNSVEQIVGTKPTLSTAGGTSDGRFIAPTGAEVVELGPSNETIHKIDECVRLEDIDKLSKIYEKLLIAINTRGCK